MAEFLLQEDAASKILLEDNTSKFLLETSGVTAESANIRTKTTLSGTDIRERTDTATLRTKTTLSGIDVLYRDSASIKSTTKLSTSSDVVRYIDNATVKTYTSLVGSYLVEAFIIATRDYNFNVLNIAYSFDGSFPVFGNVGTFDDDTGQL